MNLNRAQRIKFLAEKLAIADKASEFFMLYGSRAERYGTDDYEIASRLFRTFMQPYIDQARIRVNADIKAKFMVTYDVKPMDSLPIVGIDDAEDEEFCVKCGKVLENSVEEDICDDCANEGKGGIWLK